MPGIIEGIGSGKSNEGLATIRKRYNSVLKEKKANPHNAEVAARLLKLRKMLNRAALEETK